MARKAAPLGAELFAAKGRAAAQTEAEAAGGRPEAAGVEVRQTTAGQGQLGRGAPPGGDGRSLRATGRTHRFGTTAHPDWIAKVKEIAARDRLLIVEVLERAVEAYEREREQRR